MKKKREKPSNVTRPSFYNLQLENMLRLPLMRVCIWTVAAICLLGNIGVFLVRCLVTNDSPVHSIIIRNLCGESPFINKLTGKHTSCIYQVLNRWFARFTIMNRNRNWNSLLI